MSRSKAVRPTPALTRAAWSTLGLDKDGRLAGKVENTDRDEEAAEEALVSQSQQLPGQPGVLRGGLESSGDPDHGLVHALAVAFAAAGKDRSAVVREALEAYLA
jgi:hypothetical protein